MFQSTSFPSAALQCVYCYLSFLTLPRKNLKLQKIAVLAEIAKFPLIFYQNSHPLSQLHRNCLQAGRSVSFLVILHQLCKSFTMIWLQLITPETVIMSDNTNFLGLTLVLA